MYRLFQQFFCILDIGNNLEKVDTIIHELLHFNSFQSVEKLDWKIIKSNTRMRRGGITIASYDKKQQLYPSHIYFEGLNEGLVEKLAEELIDQLSADDQQLFDRRPVAGEYKRYTVILNIILSDIARYRKENRQATWARFKRGFITGEMTHLGDVDKVFGAGALRVLAALGSGDKIIKSESEFVETMGFFKASEQSERDRLARNLLTEREWLLYQKRRQESKK